MRAVCSKSATVPAMRTSATASIKSGTGRLTVCSMRTLWQCPRTLRGVSPHSDAGVVSTNARYHRKAVRSMSQPTRSLHL